MSKLLFFVKNGNEKHYFYDLEKAKNYFESNGGRLYAYTKNLFPTVALLYW